MRSDLIFRINWKFHQFFDSKVPLDHPEDPFFPPTWQHMKSPVLLSFCRWIHWPPPRPPFSVMRCQASAPRLIKTQTSLIQSCCLAKRKNKKKAAATKTDSSNKHSGHVGGVCERNLGSLRGEIASRLETSVALSKWWLNTNRNQSERHSSSKQVISTTTGERSWCLRGLALA